MKNALDRESQEKVQAMISKTAADEEQGKNDRAIYEGEVELEKARIMAESRQGGTANINVGGDVMKHGLEQAKLVLKEKELALKDKQHTVDNATRNKAIDVSKNKNKMNK